MTTFDERKDAFEAKFAHDQSLMFKVEARANKLLGQWAADILELPEDEVADYVRTVIKSDFEEAGKEDVFRKLAGDLGSRVTEDQIRVQIQEFTEVAKQQVMSES